MTTHNVPELVTRLYANHLDVPLHVCDKVLNETDNQGRTVLHYIAGGLTDSEGKYYDEDDVKAIQWLVSQNANLNAKDVTGKTALHYLVDRCSESPGKCYRALFERNSILDCIAVLLRGKADPNVKDGCGLWPVARAVIFGATDVLNIVNTESNIDMDITCGTRSRPCPLYTGVYEPLVEKYWLNKNIKFDGCTVDDFATGHRIVIAALKSMRATEVVLRRSSRTKRPTKEWCLSPQLARSM